MNRRDRQRHSKLPRRRAGRLPLKSRCSGEARARARRRGRRSTHPLVPPRDVHRAWHHPTDLSDGRRRSRVFARQDRLGYRTSAPPSQRIIYYRPPATDSFRPPTLFVCASHPPPPPCPPSPPPFPPLPHTHTLISPRGYGLSPRGGGAGRKPGAFLHTRKRLSLSMHLFMRGALGYPCAAVGFSTRIVEGSSPPPPVASATPCCCNYRICWQRTCHASTRSSLTTPRVWPRPALPPLPAFNPLPPPPPQNPTRTFIF